MQKNTAKNIRLIIFYNLLTIGILLLIFRFGVYSAVKISEFIQKDKYNISDNGSSYLPEPKLNSLPVATNSAELIVSGYSLSNQQVVIKINEQEEKTIDSNSDGYFESKINLQIGENNFYAMLKDQKGKLSAPSGVVSIRYKSEPPSLEISQPNNEDIVRGKNNIFEIKGKTEKENKLYINEHLIIVDEEGNFTFSVKLETGENIYKVICLDEAQNKTEKEIKIRYQR